MVSQDNRSQKSPPSSGPRDVPGNNADYASNPVKEREDTGIRLSHPSTSCVSLRSGGCSRMEFVAPQSSSTGGPWWQPLRDYATPTFRRIVEIAANASHSERQFFSVALGIVVAWFLFSTVTSGLVFFVRPVCSLPVVSIPFCHWEPPVRWADYPTLVDLQARNFNQLLDESVDYEKFVLEVKKAERVSNSLTILVGMSELESKSGIAERLGKLADDMRVAGQGLHSLRRKIHGAVNSIAILNEHALQTIEASRTPPSLAARVLPFSFSNDDLTKRAVMETFLLSLNNIASQAVRLRGEAEISMDNLIALRGVTRRGNNELKAAREDVLAELWGSWWSKPDADPHDLLKAIKLVLNSVKNLENYRRNALANVVGTLQTLQALDTEMKELRARVTVPDIIGDKIPVEMHIRSIKAGVDRLKNRDAKAT